MKPNCFDACEGGIFDDEPSDRRLAPYGASPELRFKHLDVFVFLQPQLLYVRFETFEDRIDAVGVLGLRRGEYHGMLIVFDAGAAVDVQTVGLELRPHQSKAFADPQPVMEEHEEEEAFLSVLHDGEELLEFLLRVDLVSPGLRGRYLGLLDVVVGCSRGQASGSSSARI